MSVIVPAILVPNPDEYKAGLERVHTFAKRVHVDITDGMFAPSQTILPNQIWWPQEWQIDIHAMVTDPTQYLEALIALRPHMIIFHAEAQVDMIGVIQKVKASGVKAGVALLKTTVPSEVTPIIEAADHVMIFSGDLGKYGGVASLMQLEKVRLVKAINAGVEIGWDGGVNVENAFSLAQGGVDVLNVGGAIQRANDPAAVYAALEKEVSKQGVM